MATPEERLERIRKFVENTSQLNDHTRQWLRDVIDGTDEAPKTPADKLADVCDEVGRCGCGCGSKVKAAVDEYRSTRNGIGATTAETFGSPPDPIKIARFLLDSLTGGALSSLICQARDFGLPNGGGCAPMFEHDRLRANLRALGEKVED